MSRNFTVKSYTTNNKNHINETTILKTEDPIESYQKNKEKKDIEKTTLTEVTNTDVVENRVDNTKDWDIQNDLLYTPYEIGV